MAKLEARRWNSEPEGECRERRNGSHKAERGPCREHGMGATKPNEGRAESTEWEPQSRTRAKAGWKTRIHRYTLRNPHTLQAVRAGPGILAMPGATEQADGRRRKWTGKWKHGPPAVCPYPVILSHTHLKEEGQTKESEGKNKTREVGLSAGSCRRPRRRLQPERSSTCNSPTSRKVAGKQIAKLNGTESAGTAALRSFFRHLR